MKEIQCGRLLDCNLNRAAGNRRQRGAARTRILRSKSLYTKRTRTERFQLMGAVAGISSGARCQLKTEDHKICGLRHMTKVRDDSNDGAPRRPK